MNGKTFLAALMVLIGITATSSAQAYDRYGRHGGGNRGYRNGYNNGYNNGAYYGGGYSGGNYGGGYGGNYGGGYGPGYVAPRPRVVVQIAPPPVYVYGRPRYYAAPRNFCRPAPRPYRGGHYRY